MSLGFNAGEVSLFLVGATGTGKSSCAMELARWWGGGRAAAILCLDAMQVYRGADIGTGKPTEEERAEVPHGGLDLVDFGSSFDVAHYLRHAAAFLQEQREAGRRVIIVGGTGLYFRALTRGLCEAPQGPEELRAELASLSVAELQARLKARDPAMLARVDAANPRRLARAIEVFESTGKSLRTWQEETPEPLVKAFTALWIQRKRDELFERIEARVEAMFAAGWVEEVQELAERHGMEAVKGFAGIGYGEIVAELNHGIPKFSKLTELERNEEGRATEVRGQGRSQVQLGNEGAAAARSGSGRSLTLQEMKSNISMATRQYAKRQLTWFAREPNLQQVLLIGNQPLSTVVSTLL